MKIKRVLTCQECGNAMFDNSHAKVVKVDKSETKNGKEDLLTFYVNICSDCGSYLEELDPKQYLAKGKDFFKCECGNDLFYPYVTIADMGGKDEMGRDILKNIQMFSCTNCNAIPEELDPFKRYDKKKKEEILTKGLDKIKK